MATASTIWGPVPLGTEDAMTIRDLLNEAGLTPQAIADTTGCSLPYVCGWINGYRGNLDAIAHLPEGTLGEEQVIAYMAGKRDGLRAWAVDRVTIDADPYLVCPSADPFLPQRAE